MVSGKLRCVLFVLENAGYSTVGVINFCQEEKNVDITQTLLGSKYDRFPIERQDGEDVQTILEKQETGQHEKNRVCL